MDAFRRAGEEILRRFRAAEYDESVFPELAVEVLESARLHEGVTLEGLVDSVLEAQRLPPAATSKDFSDAGICVFHDPHFVIEVLTWLDASTMAHQHGFCGAFQVLLGGSLHTRYGFEVQRRVSEKLAFGRLQRSAIEHLQPGAISPILAGSRFIHRLFHLERPSLSLVVRTFVQGSVPQYAYLEPGIAYDPFGRTSDLLQRLKLLRVLQRLEHPGFAGRLEHCLLEADLYSSLLLAMEFAPALYARGPEPGLRPALRERFGELTPWIEQALAQRQRFDRLTGLRRRVTDREQRFLLALLLNTSERAEFLSLVARHGETQAPVELALSWLAGIAELRGLAAADREGLEDVARWLRAGAEVAAGSEGNRAARLESEQRGSLLHPQVG